jgi:hypothetical protein
LMAVPELSSGISPPTFSTFAVKVPLIIRVEFKKTGPSILLEQKHGGSFSGFSEKDIKRPRVIA